MKKFAFIALLLLPALAAAQAVLNGQSYAQVITLAVPAAAATTTCKPVATDAVTAPLDVKQTFSENFNALDLAYRWTPHYDGGYNRFYDQWEGYTNLDKRTQRAAAEQQLYVDPGFKGTSNAPLGLNPFIVANGLLTIRAEPTPAALVPLLSGFKVTSGVLTTRKSFAQTYGYFEARVKLPQAEGANGAVWLLPKEADRTSLPELDIVEAFSKEKDTIITTAHWKNPSTSLRTSSGCRSIIPGYEKGFHQYGMLVTPKKIVWYFDRVPYAQVQSPNGVDKPLYMQLNLAIGGNWLGDVADPENMAPVDMVVDNVVAYSERGPVGACVIDINGEKVCSGR